ncbi:MULTISPECIES: hypothetical protein [Flavobacterium]|uniref:Uncharacterized protein n=1 Tax=Flavobacterium keumense TaxID=1306518 RepID=A0ABY8N5W4_9FLAO|nr:MULTISPECIES: hypothetical protein [Flavobacterium]WGK94261.1 hypothetical protein MG292_09260 [Flavobacterium keumense]
MSDKNRGGFNLDYSDGFNIEAENFIKYKSILQRLLTASNIELVTRGMMDKECGIDAIAKIESQHYFIGLRFRKTKRDFNSITLSRHINDSASEVKKFLRNRLRPDFFIQITELINHIRITEVNIDAFNLFLEKAFKDGILEKYYNKKLLAYEFPLNDLDSNKNKVIGNYGIRNYLIEKDKLFT